MLVGAGICNRFRIGQSTYRSHCEQIFGSGPCPVNSLVRGQGTTPGHFPVVSMYCRASARCFSLVRYRSSLSRLVASNLDCIGTWTFSKPTLSPMRQIQRNPRPLPLQTSRKPLCSHALHSTGRSRKNGRRPDGPPPRI